MTPAIPAENLFRLGLRNLERRPWVIAHRGDSYHAPENTLEAARRAYQAGADAWELDVQMTRDGMPVVIHDDSLIRTTDVARRFPEDGRATSDYRVSDFDWNEIQLLDAGSWFLDAEGGPRTAARFGTLSRLEADDLAHFASGMLSIPTLTEALELTRKLNWLVNVELKVFPTNPDGLIDAVLRVIDETRTASRVLLSSFDHRIVATIAQRRPDILTGVLAATPLHRAHEYVREIVGADLFHPSTEVLGAASDAYRRRPSTSSLRRDILSELRSDDVPVLVYTVNDSRPGGLADHLIKAGVMGIFTDDPRSFTARWR